MGRVMQVATADEDDVGTAAATAATLAPILMLFVATDAADGVAFPRLGPPPREEESREQTTNASNHGFGGSRGSKVADPANGPSTSLMTADT